MDYDKILSGICDKLNTSEDSGQVASYIPELSKIDPNKFGVHMTTIESGSHSFGDIDEKFSIQSIAKVLSLTLAYNLEGESVWKRVGVEPSGTPFNSLVLLEHNKGIPRNAMVNAGALVICDILISSLNSPKNDFLQFVRKVSDNPNIEYSARIAASEKSTSFRNTAVVNLMKSFGNIKNDIDEVMDFYFNLCSIEMTCKELARTFLFLATDGKDPFTDKIITSPSKSKRINSIMQLCGFYDEAGEFSFRVGLPGKSGVGGGIVAILPDKYCIVVWSPRLNSKGNSYKGMKFLEMFTTETETSIF
jgi:glutaminase